MSVREELTQRIADLASRYHAVDPAELADKIVEEWYETRAEWVEKLVSRSSGDLDMISFLVDNYPDGDEDF